MAEDPTHTAASGRIAAPEPTAPPGSPPGYELLDEIGRGGMGVVYRARDTALDRDVAVKLLSERYPAESPAAQRFLSEARITGQLQHPGIPAVHQVGALADGRPFLAMKLIKGSTLEAILKQRPSPLPLSPEGRGGPGADRGRLLAVFEAACQAVGYAHAHRVIHRDLKPANVMVGAFGEVQVMDWGLAKVLGEETPAAAETLAAEQTRAWTQLSPTPEIGSHTQAGSLVGTPAFIPPEQAVGQIERVNERSDVFGLGALLAVILTGQPPYVGETFESVRVQAVRGKLEDCFARLDGSGAEPELAALCKQCLAFEPADRPADAGAVAAAVAGLRAAADERARRAELERVRVEGEQATALARSAERRKRRRLVIGAAAVLAVAVVAGLGAVLAVQRRANADLAGKNHELADEQAKVEARFDMAMQAIALFHTGVSEDALLKNPQFEGLRTKLLKEAADFYADLEKLLAGQTDAKLRKALAEGYFQLAELTDKIGDKEEALAAQRKALAIFQKLVDANPAVSAFQIDLADTPHRNIGQSLSMTGKPDAAMEDYRKALAIAQKLVDANPAVTGYQRELAGSHDNIGRALSQTGKPEEALTEFRQALAIRQKLADANPEFQSGLSWTRHNLAWTLAVSGRVKEAFPLLATAVAADPKDLFLASQLAALQAWFGRDKELAATLERMRAVAKDTKDAGTAERAARACCILPSTNKAELEAALALARKGVELDKDSEWREWRLLALGMAEYRSGHYAAADEALIDAAAKVGPNNRWVTGIAAFYRAMSLFRQGKEAEARRLALAAAATMKPSPKDGQNPLADNATHDDLIQWLAYKEAKAMIQFDEKKAERAP